MKRDRWWLYVFKSDGSGYVSGWDPDFMPPPESEPDKEYVLVREVPREEWPVNNPTPGWTDQPV